MILAILGILSSVVFLIGDTPYLLDTIHGKIKPQRITWGIVSLINGINFFNQMASGATNSLWLYGAGTLMTGAIFLAALKNGVGGFAKLDIFSLTASLLGIILWQALDSPWFSILINIGIALVSIIPTAVKAARDPESENGLAYIGGVISCVLAIISVGKLDWMLIILPVAGAVIQLGIIYIIYLMPRKAKQ